MNYESIPPEARRMLETVRVNGCGITVIGEIKPLPHRGPKASPDGKGDGGEP